MSYDHEHAAQFVLPERCAHCGHKKVTWSPERIILAAQAWTEKHGRPPRAIEWRRVAIDRPNQQTVAQVFGSWNRMILAAGVDARRREHGSGPVWSKQHVAEAMLDWLARTGSWPTAREWTSADADNTARPSYLTVVAIFGSWNKAKRYAGWTGSRRCGGCAGKIDARTPGCRTCKERHRWRAVRARIEARKLGAGLTVVEPAAEGSDAGADGESHPARPKPLFTETAAQAA